ncbi:hypothetical protein DEO72_LG8g3005 [Vigna unguiculata]|uniref:Uncharacterized protein n=1 Tax=Vigna unguiculata TaxID=3917 RepID=A0A4D6MU69_VIGUN|nr:hypothetical protein DEO72_LG8g3005 [Vigna unguiculata]
MQFRGCCRNGLLWLLRGRFEGAAVEELWFVPAPHSCFGFSCWLQMTRILLFVVQRVSNGGEVHYDGVRDEAMVVRFVAANGGETLIMVYLLVKYFAHWGTTNFFGRLKFTWHGDAFSLVSKTLA